MPSIEQPVPVQTDTLTTNPVPVRMITVNVIGPNGVAMPAQMQVVAIADGDGNIIGQPFDMRPLMLDLVGIMSDIRVMMSKLSDMPFTDNQNDQDIPAGVQSPG